MKKTTILLLSTIILLGLNSCFFRIDNIKEDIQPFTVVLTKAVVIYGFDVYRYENTFAYYSAGSVFISSAQHPPIALTGTGYTAENGTVLLFGENSSFIYGNFSLIQEKD